MLSRVDDNSDTGYNLRIKALFRSIASLAPLVAIALLACAARSEPLAAPMEYVLAGSVDTAAERAVVQANAPERPLWIKFDWDAREREARFTGQGAARIDAPDFARLDLFGPRGESYLSAAVMEGEIILPASEAAAVVPPPALLWGALGIFQPPAGGELTASVRDHGRLRLDYQDGAARWRFDFEADRLRRIEWIGSDGGRKTVELKGEASFGLPREALYRDWAAFTELKLKLGEVESVDSFPPETWQLYAH